MLKGRQLTSLVNFTTIRWRSESMITDIEKIRQDVHSALTANLICMMPDLEEMYRIVNEKGTGRENEFTFKFPMKIKNRTEGIAATVYIDVDFSDEIMMEIDNEYYFYHVLMNADNKPFIQKIEIDEDILVKMDDRFVSNLDMEHWDAMRDLAYIVEAFKEQFME